MTCTHRVLFPLAWLECVTPAGNWDGEKSKDRQLSFLDQSLAGPAPTDAPWLTRNCGSHGAQPLCLPLSPLDLGTEWFTLSLSTPSRSWLESTIAVLVSWLVSWLAGAPCSLLSLVLSAPASSFSFLLASSHPNTSHVLPVAWTSQHLHGPLLDFPSTTLRGTFPPKR